MAATFPSFPSMVTAEPVDIIVVGGGLAGLSSAVRAAELGAKVVLLEQGSAREYPCNSRYSGGMFHLDYHDIAMPHDQLVPSLLKRVPADVDSALVALIARHARRAVAWLEQTGKARFVRVGPAPYERWVLTPPRPPKPGLVWPGRGPDMVLRQLAQHLDDHGMQIRRGHRVVDVGPGGGGQYAVHAEADGKALHLVARAVVFADGGFQANAALLERHITADPSRVLQRNAGTGLGSSLALAPRLGARLSGLQPFYGHLVSRDALRNTELWPYPMMDGLAKAGIVVDPAGRRIANQGAPTGVHIANLIARRPDPADGTVIVDDVTWRSVGRMTRVPPNPVLTNRGGRIFSAPDLAQLADQAAIDRHGLAETVAEFNAVEAGPTSPSAPGIRAAPFHAIPVCAGITYTMGGIMVDARARLRGADDAPLPGLFGAGAAVGGIEGGASSFYLGGLCKALVLGVISGENAAASVLHKQFEYTG